MELKKCMGCMEDFQGIPCPECGFDPKTAGGPEYALTMGTALGGKYVVGKVLGQGGFGLTYIGWDMLLERKVAIKEYYPSGQVSRRPGATALSWYSSESARTAKESGMEMFLKEARKMVKVDRIPNVVRVLDVLQENDTAYIVMEYVKGETLKDRLRRTGPLSWEQAKPIFLPAIQAMDKVHKAGLVHRDLSPDNLMLTPEGKVEILDLGAAKDVNSNGGVSSMQVAKGGFSPIEQYIDRGGSGSWSDVYAMAATMYYAFTGKVPPNSVDRMEEDTIDWTLPALKALPAPVLDTLKKAMAVSAKERLQSMEELEKGLFYEKAPKTVSTSPKTAKKAVWIAVALIAAGLCGVGVWQKVIRPGNEYKQAQALLDAEQYTDAAEAFEALGSYKDSADKAAQAREEQEKAEAYSASQNLMDAHHYFQAMRSFAELHWKDSDLQAQAAKEQYWKVQRQRTLSAFYNHTIGIRSDGTVLHKGFTGNELTMFRDSNGAIGLKMGGAENLSDWENVVAVAGGGQFSLGLCKDGTVLAKGDNSYGQCDVVAWNDIISISAGSFHALGLRSDGTVVATGLNTAGQCDVSGWKDIVMLAGGDVYSVGLKSDGTVVAAGSNDYQQCDVSEWKDIVKIATTGVHTVGLRSDGTVVATGWDGYKQCAVENWTDIVDIAAGVRQTVGLRSDGTVIAIGGNDDGQCDVEDWTDIVAVYAGGYHTLGLCSDGSVVATGQNEDDQCDVNDWTDILVP